MSLGLHNLQASKGAKKRKRNRVGRGNSSGHGTYSTRGLKGQKARSGGKKGLKVFGMKMVRLRIPKYKGMKSFQQPVQSVNLSDLQRYFKDGDVVDPKILFKKQLVDSSRFAVKVLGKGKLENKLKVNAHQFSASAKEAIEKVGGEAIVLEFKRKGDGIQKSIKSVKSIKSIKSIKSKV